MRLRPYGIPCLLSTLAVLVVSAAPADAQVARPFKITGGGVAPEGLALPGDVTTHLIRGGATHLGRHRGRGSFVIGPPVPTSETTLGGTFGSDGPCVFVAANGDKLVCHYGRTDKGAEEPGEYELTIVGVTDSGDLIVEALFVAEFVVQPRQSTGRFAGATGNWIMYAATEEFVLGATDPTAYEWEGEGELTLRRRRCWRYRD